MDKPSYWESAIFEAIDKVLALGGGPVGISHNPRSWILSEIKFFLENPFDINSLYLGMEIPAEQCAAEPGAVHLHDLALTYSLPFPLFAAHVFGGDLIPLFTKSRLCGEARSYLQPLLAKSGITEIPQRHPVL